MLNTWIKGKSGEQIRETEKKDISHGSMILKLDYLDIDDTYTHMCVDTDIDTHIQIDHR